MGKLEGKIALITGENSGIGGASRRFWKARCGRNREMGQGSQVLRGQAGMNPAKLAVEDAPGWKFRTGATVPQLRFK